MIRTIKYSLFAALVLGVVSCQKEQDPVFESSASARVESSIKEYREILQSPENGWVLQYFPGASQNLGGFNYYIKFKDFNLADVVLESGDAVESEYQIHQNGGVVISFVTYNEKMHFFSTPSASSPRGYQGDYEFIVVSKTDNTIHLKGLKYRSDLILKKIESSRTDYIAKTLLVNGEIDGAIFGFIKEDGTVEEVDLNTDDRVLNIDGKEVSFVYTDTGIHFYEPVLINGTLVQDLSVVEDENGSKKLVSSDGKVELIFKKGIPIDIKNGNFYINYPSRDNEIKTAWDKAIKNISDFGQEVLQRELFLSKDISLINGGNIYLFAHVNSENSGRGYHIEVECSFKPSILGDDYITIIPKTTGPSKFITYFEPLVRPLTQSLKGTYKIKEVIPGMYTFVNVDDPTGRSFVLYSGS